MKNYMSFKKLLALIVGVLFWTTILEAAADKKDHPVIKPIPGFTLTLHKYLVQKRFAHSISGHQETVTHFQDLTVCSIRFRP